VDRKGRRVVLGAMRESYVGVPQLLGWATKTSTTPKPNGWPRASGGRRVSRSPSTLHWLETEVLAEERNYQGLALREMPALRPNVSSPAGHARLLAWVRLIRRRRGASPSAYLTSIPLAVAEYGHQLFEAVASFGGYWTACYRSSDFRAAGHPSAAHRSFEPGAASNHQRLTECVNRGGTPPAKRPASPPMRKIGVD
jgi:hypothetical protein